MTSVKDFGAFVEILPGKDGLCHISELSDEYVNSVADVCSVGDEMTVKVIAIDEQDRVKLSRKAGHARAGQDRRGEATSSGRPDGRRDSVVDKSRSVIHGAPGQQACRPGVGSAGVRLFSSPGPTRHDESAASADGRRSQPASSSTSTPRSPRWPAGWRTRSRIRSRRSGSTWSCWPRISPRPRRRATAGR